MDLKKPGAKMALLGFLLGIAGRCLNALPESGLASLADWRALALLGWLALIVNIVALVFVLVGLTRLTVSELHARKQRHPEKKKDTL